MGLCVCAARGDGDVQYRSHGHATCLVLELDRRDVILRNGAAAITLGESRRSSIVDVVEVMKKTETRMSKSQQAEANTWPDAEILQKVCGTPTMLSNVLAPNPHDTDECKCEVFI